MNTQPNQMRRSSASSQRGSLTLRSLAAGGRDAFVEVTPREHELRPGHVVVLDLVIVEAGLAHERVDRAIEVAAAAETLLHAVEAVLLLRDGGIGAQAVFQEVERAPGAQDAAHLAERAARRRGSCTT